MKKHYKALTVKQPWADKIASGAKTIEVRSRRTYYRGRLLITSSQKPKKGKTGVAICTVELYDCKPVSELSRAEMYATGIPEYRWEKMKGKYGWFLRNPRRVKNIPVKGQLGIFNVELPVSLKWYYIIAALAAGLILLLL